MMTATQCREIRRERRLHGVYICAICALLFFIYKKEKELSQP